MSISASLIILFMFRTKKFMMQKNAEVHLIMPVISLAHLIMEVSS